MFRAAIVGVVLAACGKTPPPSGPDYVVDDPIAHESIIAVPEPLVKISLIVRDVQGLYLFENEQLDAANIIATWAKKTNLNLESPARTREILSRAANGQDANTGKACGSPMWTLAAIERWREELHADGRLEAQVACLPQCVLLVAVSEGLDAASRDAGRTALWSAPYDPSQPWRAELAKRLGELTLAEIAPDIGSRTKGAVAKPATVDVAFAAPSEEALPAAIATSAQACLGDTGAIGLLLETDPMGAVRRCENYTQRIVANGSVASCACKHVMGAELGGGARRIATTIAMPVAASTLTTKAGKRLDAHMRPAVKRDAGSGLYLPIVTNRSVREWEPPMPWAIAACFADLAPAAAAIHARVMIVVDGATAAASIGDLQIDAGALTEAQTTCLRETVARATKVPCPEPGTHALSAELVVEQH